MKTTKISILLMAIAATFFYSCDKLAFDIDQTFSNSFDVEITEAYAGAKDFKISDFVDLSAGELKENIDEVDELTINSIKVTFSNYTGEANSKVNGSVEFPQIIPEIYNLPELNISDLATTGDAFVMYTMDGVSFPGDDQFPANDFIQGLETFLKTLPADQLNTNYIFNASEVPIGFKANLEVDITATVNPTK